MTEASFRSANRLRTGSSAAWRARTATSPKAEYWSKSSCSGARSSGTRSVLEEFRPASLPDVLLLDVGDEEPGEDARCRAEDGDLRRERGERRDERHVSEPARAVPRNLKLRTAGRRRSLVDLVRPWGGTVRRSSTDLQAVRRVRPATGLPPIA